MSDEHQCYRVLPPTRRPNSTTKKEIPHTVGSMTNQANNSSHPHVVHHDDLDGDFTDIDVPVYRRELPHPNKAQESGNEAETQGQPRTQESQEPSAAKNASANPHAPERPSAQASPAAQEKPQAIPTANGNSPNNTDTTAFPTATAPAAPQEEGTTGVTGVAASSPEAPTPQRDPYEILGRARPQRIEPRAAVPPQASPPTQQDAPATSTQPAHPSPNPQRWGLFEEETPSAAGHEAAGSAPAYQPQPSFGYAPPARGQQEPGIQTQVAPAPGMNSAPATADAAPTAPENSPEAPPQDTLSKTGTLSFGLFLLRILLGGWMLLTGLQYLFAFGGNNGLNSLEAMLSDYSGADLLAVGIAVAFTVAGALLILGLGTPCAAALGAVAAGFLTVHYLSQWEGGLFPSTMDPVIQFMAAITVTSFVVIFTGPGRVSVDRSRSWTQRPLASAWIFAILGLAGIAAIWFFAGGGNPLPIR